jgi:hypothetical protein
MRVLCFLVPFFFLSIGGAVVDMRNANYSESWLDIEVPTTGLGLKVNRTYNSRTMHNGLFGFGWCSDFETKLTVMPDGFIRVKECGAGSEVEYRPGSPNQGISSDSKDGIIASIMAEVRKRNPKMDKSYFTNLEADIKKDSLLKDEFVRQLALTGQAKTGLTYYAVGKINDTVALTGSNYVRTWAGGLTQVFNKDGFLTEQKDLSGNGYKIERQGPKITKVSDSSGDSLRFKFPANSKYVGEILGPRNIKVTYTHQGEKLAVVKNSWGKTFKYEYDDLYNLKKITYPDGKVVTIDYNKDNDWVVGFRDRDGCQETYKYAQNQSDPLNAYSSSVVKKCGDQVTNTSSYEFLHKIKPDGTRYLAKTKSVINGKLTENEYHPDHGRPIRTLTDGRLTTFQYFPNGMMQVKLEPGRESTYVYDEKCWKPKKVTTKLFSEVPGDPARKTASTVQTRTTTTDFQYEPGTCILDTAKNSDGLFAKVKHDRRGRPIRIEDQSKKVVTITYEERFGKPSVVERPGVGKIKFIYKANSEVDRVESDDAPLAAVQVGAVFSNLIEIIAPGTTDGPI